MRCECKLLTLDYSFLICAFNTTHFHVSTVSPHPIKFAKIFFSVFQQLRDNRFTQSEEHMAPDLGVMSSIPHLVIEMINN